jgi:hypothetical protein
VLWALALLQVLSEVGTGRDQRSLPLIVITVGLSTAYSRHRSGNKSSEEMQCTSWSLLKASNRAWLVGELSGDAQLPAGISRSIRAVRPDRITDMMLLIDRVPVNPRSGHHPLLLFAVLVVIGLMLGASILWVALRKRAALRKWVALRKRV